MLEFKQEVRLAEDFKSLAAAARRLGVIETTCSSW